MNHTIHRKREEFEKELKAFSYALFNLHGKWIEYNDAKEKHYTETCERDKFGMRVGPPANFGIPLGIPLARIQRVIANMLVADDNMKGLLEDLHEYDNEHYPLKEEEEEPTYTFHDVDDDVNELDDLDEMEELANLYDYEVKRINKAFCENCNLTHNVGGGCRAISPPPSDFYSPFPPTPPPSDKVGSRSFGSSSSSSPRMVCTTDECEHKFKYPKRHCIMCSAYFGDKEHGNKRYCDKCKWNKDNEKKMKECRMCGEVKLLEHGNAHRCADCEEIYQEEQKKKKSSPKTNRTKKQSDSKKVNRKEPKSEGGDEPCEQCGKVPNKKHNDILKGGLCTGCRYHLNKERRSNGYYGSEEQERDLEEEGSDGDFEEVPVTAWKFK